MLCKLHMLMPSILCRQQADTIEAMTAFQNQALVLFIVGVFACQARASLFTVEGALPFTSLQEFRCCRSSIVRFWNCLMLRERPECGCEPIPAAVPHMPD